MTSGAPHHWRALTIRAALYPHRVRNAVRTVQGIVTGDMAVHATRVPQDHGCFLKRLV
jgi:hypothetical protein